VTVAEDFEALYTAHFGPLSGYLLSLVGEPGVAVELAQEAFTRLLSKWLTVRDPRAWVFFVGTNLARDHWRSAARDRALAQQSALTTQDVAGPHDPWLSDLVSRLPLRLREVVLLHYYADLPLEEVARLVHRPLGTVKRRLHEARRALAVDLGET
jgi:RNA polymerase sigma-70 factor (ECF subfamily)